MTSGTVNGLTLYLKYGSNPTSVTDKVATCTMASLKCEYDVYKAGDVYALVGGAYYGGSANHYDVLSVTFDAPVPGANLMNGECVSGVDDESGRQGVDDNSVECV
jgi:hypothetical protein